MTRRFTAEEDDIIRADYADYVDVRAMAIKLGRDYGTLRQRIFFLRLKRDSRVTRMLKWCPEHLKPVLKEQGSAAFIEAVNNNLDELKQNDITLPAEESAAEKAALDACMAEIESSPLERKEKMLAMRAIGMTLESIGRRFGLTRERVRQLTDPDYALRYWEARKGSVENLLSANKKLEEKIAANKQRIKVKSADTLRSCWWHLDEDARAEFLQYVKYGNTEKE